MPVTVGTSARGVADAEARGVLRWAGRVGRASSPPNGPCRSGSDAYARARRPLVATAPAHPPTEPGRGDRLAATAPPVRSPVSGSLSGGAPRTVYDGRAEYVEGMRGLSYPLLPINLHCADHRFRAWSARCFRFEALRAMSQAPAPYDSSSYGMNPYGGGYGHPGMMGGPPQMQGGYGMGNMGGGSSGEHNAYYQMSSRPTGRTGRGGIVPFRAGDWKCGNDGCYYHNFAKNVSICDDFILNRFHPMLISI